MSLKSLAFVAAMDDLKPVTHILAVDVTSKKGMNLLHEGIRYLVSLYNRKKPRVSFALFVLVSFIFSAFIVINIVVLMMLFKMLRCMHYDTDRRV